MRGVAFYKQKNTLINVEWQFMRGGFCHIGRMNWTFLHRFITRGNPMYANEQEFIIRGQVALDHEDKFSWFTFEFMNMFEARPVYIWIRVWPNTNLKLVFNIGWRLTRASRDVIQQQVMQHERKMALATRKIGAQINGGR